MWKKNRDWLRSGVREALSNTSTAWKKIKLHFCLVLSLEYFSFRVLQKAGQQLRTLKYKEREYLGWRLNFRQSYYYMTRTFVKQCKSFSFRISNRISFNRNVIMSKMLEFKIRGQFCHIFTITQKHLFSMRWILFPINIKGYKYQLLN